MKISDCTFANSEDPDEIQHNAEQFREKEIQFNLEIITFDPSMYTMDHPKVFFLISNQKEEFIST